MTPDKRSWFLRAALAACLCAAVCLPAVVSAQTAPTPAPRQLLPAWIAVTGAGGRNQALRSLIASELAQYSVPVTANLAQAGSEVRIVASEIVPACPRARPSPSTPAAPPASMDDDFMNAQAQVRLVIKLMGERQSLQWAGAANGSAWCELRRLAEARAATIAAARAADPLTGGNPELPPPFPLATARRLFPVYVALTGAGARNEFLRSLVELGLYDHGVPVTERQGDAASQLQVTVADATTRCPGDTAANAAPAQADDSPLRSATVTMTSNLLNQQRRILWSWTESTLAGCAESLIATAEADSAPRIADGVAATLRRMKF